MKHKQNTIIYSIHTSNYCISKNKSIYRNGGNEYGSYKGNACMHTKKNRWWRSANGNKLK
jgi:hypothetical protein